MKVSLTEEEFDLIQSIRNYRKSCPPSLELEYYIERLLSELMDKDS